MLLYIRVVLFSFPDPFLLQHLTQTPSLKFPNPMKHVPATNVMQLCLCTSSSLHLASADPCMGEYRERNTHTHIYVYMYVLEMCENHAINYVTMPSAFRQVGGYPDPQGDALLPSARHGQNNSWNDLLGVCKVIVLEICQCRCGL